MPDVKIRNVKTISKWGDTLVVGLKKEFEEINAEYRDRVIVTVQGHVINIRKEKTK